jgi:hypothetical protein
MKYIITEKQEERIKVLRRLQQDWSWIREIVDEGTDIDDPCDFKNEEIYLNRVCRDSANTYLYYYMDNWQTETFKTLSLFIQDLIKTKMGDEIIDYYIENKEECEQYD